MAKRPARGTLKESVYASLRAMILTGELHPGGRLTEGELAERLKVSRTPVREALNRLERDGLVTTKPHHGYAVSAFDQRAFEDAFDVRAVLDGHAAERATATMSSADKDRLRAMVRQCEAMAVASDRSMQDLIEEMHVGLEIHRVIARASGNALLAETLSRILDRCQYFVWLELLWLDEWAVARREHAAIVEAICAGEGALAAELARNHVRGSRNNILRFLKARSAYRDALRRGSEPGAAPELEWPRAPSASLRLDDRG